MTLRFKLLLVALSTLALPWAGWQFVRQTEALLRQGQEQALLASTRMLAQALAASGPSPDETTGSLFIHAADEAPRIDGYADDWLALRPYAQSLGPADDPDKLRATLAQYGEDRHLLLDVRDATRTRAEAGSPRVRDSDHVLLVLQTEDGASRYLLAGSAPGSFRAPAEDDAAAASLPDFVAGALQEDGSGYRIELRLPRGVERIGLAVRDAAHPGATAPPALRPLSGYDEAQASVLARLVPPHARARVVMRDGWRIAEAGRLDGARDPDTAGRGWLGGLVYRAALAPALDGSPQLDGDRPRLDAAEVRRALAGEDVTSWRADAGGGVILAAAVPTPDGALLLEQASRALPSLANRALTGLALATLSALLVAGLVLLAFGVSLSWRIRRLRNAAERAVHASGRLSGPMPLADAPDELGDLARSFARLTDEVGAYTDYLRTLASKLSHELNTPLAIVKSSLDNLDEAVLPEDARAYLKRARDGAERLGAIVRAMSEAGRVERAIASADAEDFDLRALVSGCAESYRPLAEPRRLDLQLPDAPVPFHGAPELIAQALDKLFDNACTFTPESGRIALALSARDGGAVIRMANTGPLLPAAMQERLFDSLVSVRGRSSREGGTPHLGLGLYVVRLVAELHRGTARADNLADGSGVAFTLDLAGMPRRRLSEADAA